MRTGRKNMDSSLQKKRIAAFAGIGVFAAAMITVYFTCGRELTAFVKDTAAFKAWLCGFGAAGRAVFVGIRALQTVVKIIPAEPLEIGAGCAFGTWGGLLWCMTGTQIGSLVILALSKKLGMRFTSLFVSEDKLKSFEFLRNSERLRELLFGIYLIPGTPKDLITYFVWMTPMKPAEFLLITGIARIPSIITSTLCGSQLISGNYFAAAAIFIGTTVAGAIGMAVYAKFRKASAKKPKPPEKTPMAA